MKKLVCYAFSPLFNFKSKVELISVEKNLTITKVPKEKREALHDKILPPPLKDFIIPASLSAVAGAVAECEYALIIRGESKYANEEFLLSSDSIAQSLLSSLRLYKEGRVTAGITLFWHEAEPKYYLYFGPPILSRSFGPPYVLLESEANDFVEFWKKYKNVDVSKGSLRVAVGRFNRSYDMTVLLEDKLIDYIIAFESLYLTRKKYEPRRNYVQQKNKMIALAASYFIGEDNTQREQIHDALKQAYIKRNRIVHGKAEKIENVEIAERNVSFEDFVYLIEEYLRRSIKKHIDLPVRYERNLWDLENLSLRYLGSKGEISRVGYFNGTCPFCEAHIGTDVFEDQSKQKHAWCGSCRREIFKNIDQQKIAWISA